MKNLFLSRNLLFLFLVIIAGNVYSQDELSAVVAIVDSHGFVGTGFVTGNGVYTTEHVIEDLDSIFVVYENGYKSAAFIDSISTYTNVDDDIALLKVIEPIETKVLILSNEESELSELDDVFSVGHPNVIMYMYYKGYVHKSFGNSYLVSFDVAGGMSGAPLIGEDGLVYGMIQAISANFNGGVTYARKMNILTNNLLFVKLNK